MTEYKPISPEISQEEMRQRFIAFRNTHDLTKTQMAEILNVPLNTYVLWEKENGMNVRHKTIMLHALRGIEEAITYYEESKEDEGRTPTTPIRNDEEP